MDLIFPDRPPETRDELKQFIDVNLPLLKILSLADTAQYLAKVTSEELFERIDKGGKEYGEFCLHTIPAVTEKPEEDQDSVIYYAIKRLQQRFTVDDSYSIPSHAEN